LAGKVSRGKAIKGKQVSEFQELARSTSRKKTEDNLGAAEQKVDDFSDEQMESMAKQGVAFHFTDVDITKVLPEKLKRTIYGYGFYTTSEGQSNSVFRTYGDRVTLIDTNQLNLLDGDTRITEEQARKLRDFAKMELDELDETGELVYFPEKAIVLQSLAELKAGSRWANVLIEGSAEAVFGDVKMVPRELANRSTTPDVITYDIPQQAQVAALIQEAFGFDGADFGRGVNMDDTRYGIISAIWNFDKLNRAIIEPGQEPTRAAEQRTIGYEGEQESFESIINRGLLGIGQDAEQFVKRASQIKVVSDDASLNEFLEKYEDELEELAQDWFRGTRENVRRDVSKELIAREQARRLAGDLLLDHAGLYSGDVQWMPNIKVQGVTQGVFQIVLTPLTEAQKQAILDAQNAYKSTRRHRLQYTAYESMDAMADGYFYATRGDRKMRRGTYGFSAGNHVHFTVSRTDASASNRVLYHEVLHGLLNVANNMDKAKVTEAAKILRIGLDEVDYAMTPELRQAFNNFLSGYSKGSQNEEFVVDFFGQLASGYRSMSAEARALVNRFVDAVYEIFNLKPANREYVESSEDLGDNFNQYVQDTLNALAQKVVSGEVITEEELSRLSAETLTSEIESRAAEQRTVENLRAAEQKAVDFDNKRLLELSREGILAHFTSSEFEQFKPGFGRVQFFGEGIYFTNEKAYASRFSDINTRVTFVDVSGMTLMGRRDGQRRLIDPAEYDAIISIVNELGSASDAELFSEVVTQRGGLKTDLFRGFETGIETSLYELHDRLVYLGLGFETEKEKSDRNINPEAKAGQFVRSVFNAIAPEYQGILNKGVGFEDVVIWDFNAINQNIVRDASPEYGAAEQRVDVDEVRMRSRAGSRISKGLATYNVKGEKQV
jgi:hypothetical protein